MEETHGRQSTTNNPTRKRWDEKRSRTVKQKEVTNNVTTKQTIS
jgi:hypothetical protein